MKDRAKQRKECEKDKKGKNKKRAHFAKVDYDLAPIQKETVWDGVLVADSMWCYPQQGSYKMKLREVYKDIGRYNAQAKKLQKWIRENFEEEKQLNTIIFKSLNNTQTIRLFVNELQKTNNTTMPNA